MTQLESYSSVKNDENLDCCYFVLEHHTSLEKQYVVSLLRRQIRDQAIWVKVIGLPVTGCVSLRRYLTLVGLCSSSIKWR